MVILQDVNSTEKIQSEISKAAYDVAYVTRFEQNGRIYSPLTVASQEQMYKSLGFVLADIYDSTALIRFIKAGGGDTNKSLAVDKIYSDNFDIVDIDSAKFDCEELEGKIVLICDLLSGE